MNASAPDRVRLSDLSDLAAAVPYLLGFNPTESLVALALRGRRMRVSFTMRLDLPEPDDFDDIDAIASVTAARMRQAQAGVVMLFVYTAADDDGGDLPQRELVESVIESLTMPLHDAALVRDGRVRSYVCDDPRCCPAAGRVIAADSPGVLAVAAANTLHGNVVLPDREALVATAQPVGGITAESMMQAIARVGLEEIHDLEGADALLDDLCARISESPAALTHDAAAALVMRLHDIRFRDRVISRLAARDETLERLVAEVARLAQPPHDAPAAAVLAMSAYLRGDGVVAGAAAERALASDPSYSLALLVRESLSRQLEPTAVREVWLGHLP